MKCLNMQIKVISTPSGFFRPGAMPIFNFVGGGSVGLLPSPRLGCEPYSQIVTNFVPYMPPILLLKCCRCRYCQGARGASRGAAHDAC